ncbi:histidine phosphatase family protein [Bifidobacterium simiarum]|uniref:Histidine phosphatase family protein n=1 Tax=Bifidobacterium simiarum TaxID=2045441 RepID=A0A2M9HC39_9BIFI|nr:histidine phosphatase family protein [Bifidobacterium simiarum]MBT1166782.1 histidine phosphatase family protein [Bifidobacterium simiarum]PJM74370.1 histidine phosphatase family protein [Bifidobacterium simiarum]
MTLHLHLVRHGQTYFNRYNRLQGWSNSPLTESGIADAVKAGHKLESLDFAAAYCSDTTRAEQTAHTVLDINEAAGHARPSLTVDMHFREQFYGYYEGLDMAMAWYAAGAPHGAKTYNEIVSRFGLAATKDFLKQADPFHDAESEEEYWTRVEGGFRIIADDDRLKDGDDVLVISHGNTLLSLMHRFAPEGYDLSERPANGSVTVLDYDPSRPLDDGGITIVSYNR